MEKFEPTAYTLECVATGREFEDTGWMLSDPQCKEPSLIRARYARKQIEVKPAEWGLYRFADWMPVRRMLKEKWQMWEQAGVLASEMECATLFLTAAVRRVRAGAVLLVCNNHAWDRPQQPVEEDFDVGPMLQTAVEALKLLIAEDNGSC